MGRYALDDTELRIEFVPGAGHTVHGGQVAVADLCKKLDLRQLVHAEPALDPRMDKHRSFAPEVMGEQHTEVTAPSRALTSLAHLAIRL